MKDIIKIIIKGESGFGVFAEGHQDRLIITDHSVHYMFRPNIPSETNIVRKWSYKTTSPQFQKYFVSLGASVQKVLNRNDNSVCCDIGMTSFIVTYADKTKVRRDYFLSSKDFGECFSIIKQMIPRCESVPEVLYT